METETLNNEGIVAESIYANNSQLAGRDIYNETHYNNELSSGFVPVNPTAYSSSYYLGPIFTGTLAEQVKDRKLVVIAGGQGFDKGTFVRHLAACITEDYGDIKLKEWIEAEPSDRIQKEITETDEPCIYIINNASPRHLEYDPRGLARIAEQNGHIVLVTTELPQATWQLPDAMVKLYWFEVPVSGIYSKESITAELVQRIERKKRLFGLPQDKDVNQATILAGKYNVAGIAGDLETPGQVDFFVTLLEAELHDIDEEKISSALSTVTDKSETMITKWFRALPPGEKLVALGAALLDGLFDDQFFAVMQRITDDFWRHRNPNLLSLDYCDIDFLLGFFKFESYVDGRQVLGGKFDNQRAEIIRAAWSGHKRHVLSAFSVLTALAKDSSGSGSRHPGNTDIYGSRWRRMKLRSTAADTISDIGIVSLQTAEPKLVELAASGNETIRRVTAKAMARWRAFRKDEQMFETLGRWKEADSSSIRSAVVLTLQYAAEYDSPGCLDTRILDTLGDMRDDLQVAPAMKELLPRLIDRHFCQLYPWLGSYFCTRAQYRDILKEALLQLYASRPHEIKKALDHWLSIQEDEGSKDNRRQEFTHRDNLVALVLEIYKGLPYTGEDDAIGMDHVWNTLKVLNTSEQRRNLRELVLGTIAFFVGMQPDRALQYLGPIFKGAGTDDRYIIISGIGDAYLDQRSRLEGGQFVITVNGMNIPVWNNSPRPLTGIEKIMYTWLQGNDPFARELATLSFVRFSRVLDHQEPALIMVAVNEVMTKEREAAMQRIRAIYEREKAAIVEYPVMPKLSWWTHLKIFFWLLFKNERDKVILLQIMKTLLMYKETNPVHLATMISRFRQSSSGNTRLIAWWLEKLK
jgi:hypothetical protein